MVWLKWFPWKFVIRRIARAHGFLDPIALLARLRGFAQPSEVAEPIELLRAGVVLHARGLINSRVIQHNLDWVWPYWVECQFDPHCEAFIPRAFSITHINLTHRNWTAVGLPDVSDLPIVDPRGLVTPFFDGWSLDAWIYTQDGRWLLPCRSKSSIQRLDLGDSPAVVTKTERDGLSLVTTVDVCRENGVATCRMTLTGSADCDAWAVFALRPYNPEGISFIQKVSFGADRRSWTVDKTKRIRFSEPVDRHRVSDYAAGDVFNHLHERGEQDRVNCRAGMATAAALFKLAPGKSTQVTAAIPLETDEGAALFVHGSWAKCLDGHCRLSIPDSQFRFLYDAALRTLTLHSPGEVYPGPFTYKRFWFRDAAFIIHGLLCAGLIDRAERAIDLFPRRQTALGYFHSQYGEWDSNGEALWIMERFCRMSGRALKASWRHAVIRGARWIGKKRIPEKDDTRYSGLFPPGFSAEHLGPSDYYYWDDFWGVAGLLAAAGLVASIGEAVAAEAFEREAQAFLRAVDVSIEKVSRNLGSRAIPASPNRRLDSGAIGSLAAGYPLRLYAPDDPRLLDTVEYLLGACFIEGGFFQDMIHSGINAYLTLHVAQVLLRSGDRRYFQLMETVAALASPTGQWPEAIHPRTHGGCMGDGQHVWAAAEWILMIRNCFVREEDNALILASGIPKHWLGSGKPLAFGPAPTIFGPVSISITDRQSGGKRIVRVAWEGKWHGIAPRIEVRLAGCERMVATPGHNDLELTEGHPETRS